MLPKSVRWLALSAIVSLLACGGSGGSGSSSSSGAGAGSGTGTGSGSGAAQSGDLALLSTVLDFGWVAPQSPGATAALQLQNVGSAPLDGSGQPLVQLSLGGPDAGRFSVQGAIPTELQPGATASVDIGFQPLPQDERWFAATLTVQPTAGGAPLTVRLGAAYGGSQLPPAPTWQSEAIGETTVVELETAPFPHSSRSYTDNRVMVFVPAGYRIAPLEPVDLIIHFHGHGSEIVATDLVHGYREMTWRSGRNAVLVLPQGPLNAADSGGGKLEEAGGLADLVQEVLLLLRREGKVGSAQPGRLVLTSHSGGYRVTSAGLAQGGIPVHEVFLGDSLYGFVDRFESWATGGGRLYSNYTPAGGTVTENQDLAGRLQGAGLTVHTSATEAALRSGQPIIQATDIAHSNVMEGAGRYVDFLRTGGLAASDRARRPTLQTVRRLPQQQTEVTWLPQDGVAGFRLEHSTDLSNWQQVLDEQTLGPTAQSATLSVGSGPLFVRLRSVTPQGAVSEASDLYGCGGSTGRSRAGRMLIVDGFDRISGSWTQLSHPHAAICGQAAPAAFDTCANEAVLEGAVTLADYDLVVWLLGDESTVDEAFSVEERQQIEAFVDAEGALAVFGSELAWDLGFKGRTGEQAFLSRVLKVSYGADDAGATQFSGDGSIFSSAPVAFGLAAGGGYEEDFPDVLNPESGGSVVLRYPDGRGAGVRYLGPIAGGTLVVGVPFETIGSAGDRTRFLLEVFDALQ